MFNQGQANIVAPWTKTNSVSAAVNFSREDGTMRKNPDLGKRRRSKMVEWTSILRARSISPRLIGVSTSRLTRRAKRAPRFDPACRRGDPRCCTCEIRKTWLSIRALRAAGGPNR